MLRPEDLRSELYLSAAGESERIVHIPTSIERWHECRMPHRIRIKLIEEIETELLEKGLTQFVVPNLKQKPSDT